MTNESQRDRQLGLEQIQGALNVLFELREVFAQWVEEAQDESKQEALENVLGHVEAIEQEYRRRHAELRAHISER